MDKTPQQIADEFTESAASLGGAPFVPAQLRDAVASAASFAQATAGELKKLQDQHAEQGAQIEALQASMLGAHAELEARVSALEQQGNA